jgi:thiol-disulfide isomerase/thioredoxin
MRGPRETEMREGRVRGIGARTARGIGARTARGFGARTGRAALVGALALVSILATMSPLHAGGDWNDAQIAWQPYDKGLVAAKEEKKPVCLVFFTEWCPHCKSYSAVFHDPKVVEQARRFTMIRLDKDKNAEISKKYAPDGEYIPRTYFLSSAGVLDPEIHAARDQYKYFYDERMPGSVLGGMDQAHKKFGTS